MRVLMIPAFNVVDGRLEPYVPYGLLALQSLVVDSTRTAIDIAFPSETMLSTKFRSSEELVEVFLSTTDTDCFDVFGVSTVCNSAHYSIDIASKLKQKYPSSLIVLGGPFVTKLSARILEVFEFVDGVFTGEGEVSFRDFISRPFIKAEPFLGLGGVKNRRHPFVGGGIVENLDDLPFITRSLDYFKWLNLVRKHLPEGAAAPLEATRGCPLKCSFCSTKQVWGAQVRRKSAKRLVEEMSSISNVTGDKFFSFIGDNMGVPRNPFMHFCDDMISENSAFTWGCSLKLDKLDEMHLAKMWQAGCRAMFIGVESASQSTLDKVNKAASLEKEISMIRMAIDIGFQVETSFIIGFPWETEAEVRQTYELHCDLLKAGANRSQVGVLCPIPGTEIVSGHEVVFDGWTSYVAQDDVPLSDFHSRMVEEYPDLFSHFGHYETPNISRVLLKAYRDASTQFAQLYVRQRKMKQTIEQHNHGRTPSGRSEGKAHGGI